MLCIRPIKAGVAGEFGCGQCGACRINRRRELTARFLLEHAGHGGASAFLTLTYREEEVPRNENGQMVLRKRDLRNFLQRLRRIEGRTRYCAVGEYGERGLRPHFHLLHWSALRGVDERLYSSCWPHGFVHVGEVTAESIGYCVGYVLKRLTKADDPRLGGRPPEFCRWSKRLGEVALRELGRCARPNEAGELELPREFRLNGRLWPVPKYFREKLRKEGYVFAEGADALAEKAFVQRLCGSAAVLAADARVEYGRVRKGEKESRRVRSRHLIERKLKGVRRETF